MSNAQRPDIEWYFDFISPFAYLQLKQLERQYTSETIIYKPILFAGLLKHWSHKGPAEIPVKRTMTYQYCHWLAGKQHVSFKTPSAHPFNPLAVLRLAISQHCRPEVVSGIFNTIWGKGIDITQPDRWREMIDRLEVPDADEQVSQQWVKDELKTNTQLAIDKGVFGVPTVAVENRLFWGHDMTEMAFDFIDHPQQFESEEYRRLENLPIAQTRKAQARNQ